MSPATTAESLACPFIGMGERSEKVQGDAFRCAADKGTAHAPDARHARRMRAGRAGHDRAEGIEQAQQPCGLRAGGPAGRAMRHGTISNNSMKPPGAPPLNSGRGAASALRKTRWQGRAALDPPKQTLDGIMEVTGISLLYGAKEFFQNQAGTDSCAPPPHQSKVLGRWEVGVRGGGRKALLQKVFPPSFPGMSRLPTLHPATALPRKESKTRSPRSPRNGWAALRQPQAADRTTPCLFPRCPRRQQRPRR